MNSNTSSAAVPGVSRRSFLSGAFASLGAGALGGRVFAAPLGWKPKKKPNLVVGILSDTHLQSGWDGVTPHGGFPLTYFMNAMKLFRERNIDAFMHLGDAAHRGKNVEIQYHRDIFEKFFPHGRARDGHVVEKLVVCGNHELYGDAKGGPGCWAPNIWPDKSERDKHTLCGNLEKHWEQTWGEKYEPVWHKEVKGYHFFGRHWNTDEAEIANLVGEKAEELSLKGSKPFFILSHARHHFATLNRLRAFPNAVAFCGHWHMSNADWKTIFFDNFGFTSFPTIQVGACRMDGGNCLDGKERLAKGEFVEEKDDPNAAKRAAWSEGRYPSRQAMVMNVYDDMVVFERHEVGRGGKLGPDWVMPIGEFKPHPFSREELKKACGAPEFPPKAKLEVMLLSLRGDSESRSSGGNSKQSTNLPNSKTPSSGSNAGKAFRISIPMADGNPASRAYAYEVVVLGDDMNARLFKNVFFSGANAGVGHEPNHGVTTLEIPSAEIPAGKKLTIAVRPVSSLGTKGKAIGTTWRT